MLKTQRVDALVSFELEINLTATFAPGRPETPPAYSHGGLPAEPAEIEPQGINWIMANGLRLELTPEVREKILEALLKHPHLEELINAGVLENAA